MHSRDTPEVTRSDSHAQSTRATEAAHAVGKRDAHA